LLQRKDVVMNSRLFSGCAALALVAACSGAVLPVAENGSDSGTGGSDNGGQAKDSGNGSSSSGGQDGSSSGNQDAGSPDVGSSSDGGSAGCGDAGGNSCLCGEQVCVNGQWTCTSCAVDGGPDGCNPACQSGQVCVRDQIVGGAQFFVDDAGMCPIGYYPNGIYCERVPTYYCAPFPLGCNGALSCACAGSICTTQQTCQYVCRGTSGNEIDCECDVP
jgi:hypothetical protein